MEDYRSTGRVLFGDNTFAPEYDAWGSEFAYFEPEPHGNAPDAYLLYECRSIKARVELNSESGRVCLGSAKRDNLTFADYYYIEGAGVRKRHILFRSISENYYVRALNAKAKIRVNGKEIKSCASHLIRDGDVISLGDAGGAEIIFRRRPKPKADTRFGF